MNRLATFGLVFIVLLVLVALFAPLIATHDVGATNLLARYLPPSSEHQECGLGGTAVLTLNDGSTRRYGPCTKPVAIQRAMNMLYATVQTDAALISVPDVTNNCDSAKATRWRTWSGAIVAFRKNSRCS